MAETFTLSALLSDVTSLLTSVVTWVGQILGLVTGNVLLLIPFMVILISFAIGVISRVMKTVRG